MIYPKESKKREEKKEHTLQAGQIENTKMVDLNSNIVKIKCKWTKCSIESLTLNFKTTKCCSHEICVKYKDKES